MFIGTLKLCRLHRSIDIRNGLTVEVQHKRSAGQIERLFHEEIRASSQTSHSEREHEQPLPPQER